MSSRDTIIQEDGFGFVPRKLIVNSEGKPFRIVRRYTMTNKNEASVRLISWGAGIQSVRVPNSRGIFGDVVMGFDNMNGYLKNRYIGRVINSFADNTMNMHGKNCLNSETDENNNFRGNDKFDDCDSVNWESCVSGQQVIMSYVNRSRERKRLGNMLIQVKYSWTDKNELNVNIRATVTKPTPTNITIFCPMNLAGHAMGERELKNHVVTINSDNFFSIKPGLNWSTCIDKVDGTFYDLRNPIMLKNRLAKIPGGGYDNIMRINSPSDWCYRFHGRILHPDSGRFVEIYSNKANLKFSTLNNFPNPERKYPPDLESDYTWVEGCGDVSKEKFLVDKKTTGETREIRGKDGALYRRNGGFVFSPQHHSNEKSILPNNCILHPGQIFVHDLSYKFGIKENNQ